MSTPDSTQNTAPAPAAGAEHQAQPNAGLAALEREGAALDGAPAAAAAKESREVALVAVDANRAELHAVLVMARDAALPLLAIASERKATILSAIWTDDTLASIATNGAKVLALHGVKLDNIAGGFGPYLGLAMSLGPAALGTYAVLKSKDPETAERVDGQQQ